MFGPNIVRSALSIPKILNGFGSILDVVNRVIPIYKEVKPMVAKSTSLINNLKKGLVSITNNTSSNTSSVNPKINKKNTSSLPVFFQ